MHAWRWDKHVERERGIYVCLYISEYLRTPSFFLIYDLFNFFENPNKTNYVG